MSLPFPQPAKLITPKFARSMADEDSGTESIWKADKPWFSG